MNTATVKWIGLALLGLAIAGAVAFAATRLVSEQIGIASESVSAGDRLAPLVGAAAPAPRERVRATGGRAGAGASDPAGSAATPPAEPATPPATEPSSPTAPPATSSGESEDIEEDRLKAQENIEEDRLKAQEDREDEARDREEDRLDD